VEAVGWRLADLFADDPPSTTSRQVGATTPADRAKPIRGDAILLRKSFVEMTGSMPAALMLSQLQYWFDGRATRRKDGVRWVAKTYNQ